MRDYIRTGGCRMLFLREQLDDPYAEPCGRCDNCGGLTLHADVSPDTAAAAAERLARPGVTIDPRRQWPPAMTDFGIDLTGRIPAAEMAEPGRAVARFTDLGYGPRVREVVAPDRPDTPAPDDLVQAAVRVLAAWEWDNRPSVVVSVGSVSRPLLVDSLARRIAEIGRLPYAGPIPHRGPAAPSRSNSAQRLRAIAGTFEVPADIARAVAGQPVLLVDDYTATGWTLALVARHLRQAGATAVLPLVLGIAG